MANLREEFLKLLDEARKKSKYGRAIVGSEVFAPGVKEDEEERLAALLAAEKEDIVEDSVSLDSDSFRLLCIEALNNDQCLKRLEPALGADFSSDPKINPSFAAGINYLISFYSDVVESYNSRQLLGKVKTTIDSLQDASYVKKNYEDAIKNLINLFTSPKKSGTIPEASYEKMVDDISNLCIAAHIINWTRILTYQTSFNNDLMTLKDIFKPRGEKSQANKIFLSKLSDVELDKFYSKENPNVFAEYISQFPWGTRGNLNEASAFTGVQGDLGRGGGDNEVFLLNCLVSYLIDILKTGTPHPDFIFKTANAMSIQNAKSGSMYEVSRIQSLENPLTNEDPNFRSSPESPDKQDPEYNMNFGANVDAFTVDPARPEEKEEFPDLMAMEAFKDYVDSVKKENNWTSANTLEFLSKTLQTQEGADGLSEILKTTFKLLPNTVYEKDFSFPIIKGNSIETVNLLNILRDLTLRSGFINFISSLSTIVSNMPVYKESKESYITAQFDILSEAIRQTKLGLAPEDMNALISALPRTFEEALSAYSISHNNEGYTVVYNNKAASKINTLYSRLTLPLFKSLSPSDVAPVPPEGLVAGSPLQKSLGITMTPNVSITPTGMTTKEKASGQVAVRGKSTEELEGLWNVYYTAIKDILDPTINQASWGLLTPTRLGKPDEPSSSYGVLYYTPAVPAGSKAENGGLIKKLFDTPGEFTPVREAVLNKVASLKPRFLAVKTEGEVKALLQEIVATFGKAKQVRFFASPATQTCPEEKKSTLAALIDPSIAITPALKSTFKNKTFPQKTLNSNPFTDLITSAVVLNNMNESIVYKDKIVLFEAEDTESYRLVASYVAINVQIRARILLALANLMELLENMLVVLRVIITKLKTVLTHIFSEDVAGRADKFFKDISKILAGAVPKVGESSLEDLDTYLDSELKDINDRFSQSEIKSKKVSALREPIPYTGELYGSMPKA